MVKSAFRHLINAYSGFSRDIWLLTFVNFINRVGGMVVLFLSIYLTEKLGLSIGEAGLVLSAFGVGSIAGGYLGGVLTDKFSYHYVQLLSLIAQGLFLVSMPLVSGFYPMVLAAFTLSLLSDIFRPANSVAYIRHSSPENRTRAFSMARLAFNVGFTASPAIGGFLVPQGWHFLFWVDGATCLLAALALFLFIKPKKGEAQAIKEAQANPENDSVSAYKNRPFLLFTVLTFFAAFVFMQLVWTIPLFFRQVSFSEPQIGLLMSLNGLMVALIEMPLIFSIENKRSKPFFIRIGALAYGLCYLFLMPGSEVGVLLAVLSIVAISIGEIFVMPFSASFVTQLAGKTRQGQYMALYGMAYAVANIIAPLAGTQIADKLGFPTLWGLLAFLSLLLWFGFLQFEKWYPEAKKHPEAELLPLDEKTVVEAI